MAALNKYLELEGIDKLRQYTKDTGRKVEFKKGQLFFEQDCICKDVGYIQSGDFPLSGRVQIEVINEVNQAS